MIEWIKNLLTANGHKAERDRTISVAHEALRTAAQKHIEADIEAEIVLRQTTEHSNGLNEIAKSAVEAVKRGEK